MGKDLSSLGKSISLYAQGEAELQFGAANKKKSKFSLAEDSAIEKHFKKEHCAVTAGMNIFAVGTIVPGPAGPG